MKNPLCIKDFSPIIFKLSPIIFIFSPIIFNLSPISFAASRRKKDAFKFSVYASRSKVKASKDIHYLRNSFCIILPPKIVISPLFRVLRAKIAPKKGENP